MKLLILTVTLSIASAQAADYKCRSQRNGLRFSISESRKEIIVTNRLGQPVEKYEGLKTSKYTVETATPQDATMFISGTTPILELLESEGKVYAIYANDFDIICIRSKNI